MKKGSDGSTGSGGKTPRPCDRYFEYHSFEVSALGVTRLLIWTSSFLHPNGSPSGSTALKFTPVLRIIAGGQGRGGSGPWRKGERRRLLLGFEVLPASEGPPCRTHCSANPCSRIRTHPIPPPRAPACRPEHNSPFPGLWAAPLPPKRTVLSPANVGITPLLETQGCQWFPTLLRIKSHPVPWPCMSPPPCPSLGP